MSIHLPFKKLSKWQQITFAAALLERMLPNYQMFSEAEQFGDSQVLRNQLNIIWQWLANPQSVKINVEAQLNKLEPQIPDPEAFDSFGVFPALDVCMAISSLWQLIDFKPKAKKAEVATDDVQAISRLSVNSVSYFVELTLMQLEQEENESVDSEVSAEQIEAHPLMQWEKETQNELFDFLKFAAENKRSCQLAKEMVLSEGLSNLGIEINDI